MLSIRKIGVIGRTYRNLNRYRQILGVLFKYGFGDLIERLRIDDYIEIGLQMISRKRRPRVDRLTRAERVRMALEELGPTYIKLGQALSTRPDLVARDLVQELSKLQDHVHSFPYRQVQAIFKAELGAHPESFFLNFEEAVIASASIGQVHRAVLKSGETAAVKVQRPGIRRIIEVDLEIMLHLATLMERHLSEIALHNPVKIVEEFARILEKEIDFTIEARNMERFARQFLGEPTIYVPRVRRDMSTARILVMEYINGVKVSEITAYEKNGLNPKIINRRGADLFFRQVFDFGFFHADPHPGNVFVLPGNIICLLDFGVMGAIDRETREDLVDLIYSVVHQDEADVTRVLLKLTNWEIEPDVRILEKDAADLIGQYLHLPLKEIEIGKLIQQLLELASRHQLRIPPDIFFMMKAFSTVEGVGAFLDPDFDMISAAAPFIRRIKMARYAPRRMAAEMFGLSSELLRFLRAFPKDMLEISRMIKRRKFSVRFEHHGLDVMLATHDQISNKISFSIIIAALIIGSALIVISEIPPLFYGISLIGIIVFFAAAIMGVWLMAAIIRKKKF